MKLTYLTRPRPLFVEFPPFLNPEIEGLLAPSLEADRVDDGGLFDFSAGKNTPGHGIGTELLNVGAIERAVPVHNLRQFFILQTYRSLEICKTQN